MAISDIPEFIEVNPGDLIRAENWNSVQRQMRSSLRTHQHTRTTGAPPNDTALTDEADQINTAEIADGAVTADKLANAAVTATKLADGAIGAGKLGPNTVGTTNLANNSVTSSKLSFQQVAANSQVLGPGGTAEVLVQAAAPSTKTTIYFPTMSITSTTGAGQSDVEANIVYRQAVGVATIDVFLRLENHGAATANIIWVVLTFTS